MWYFGPLLDDSYHKENDGTYTSLPAELQSYTRPEVNVTPTSAARLYGVVTEFTGDVKEAMLEKNINGDNKGKLSLGQMTQMEWIDKE